MGGLQHYSLLDSFGHDSLGYWVQVEIDTDRLINYGPLLPPIDSCYRVDTTVVVPPPPPPPPPVDTLTGMESDANNGIIFQAFPNPFEERITLNFELSQSQKISLSVLDVLGQQVEWIVPDQYFAAGSHHLVWDSGHLAKGIYFMQFTTNTGERIAKKVVRMR